MPELKKINKFGVNYTFADETARAAAQDAREMAGYQADLVRMEMAAELAGKADAGVSYTKAESDDRFAKKGEGGGGGDMSNYYTKSESDGRYLREHQSLAAYRTAAQQDAIDSRFLTEHQDISGKMDSFTVGAGLKLTGGVLSLDLPVLSGQSAF